MVRKALNLELKDRTGGALYFHRRGVTSGWAAEYWKTAAIGDLVFHKPRRGDARQGLRKTVNRGARAPGAAH